MFLSVYYRNVRSSCTNCYAMRPKQLTHKLNRSKRSFLDLETPLPSDLIKVLLADAASHTGCV